MEDFVVAYTICFVVLTLLSLSFVRVFCESSKKYIYEGNEILVYAGHFHYYVKVNGRLASKRKKVVLALAPVAVPVSAMAEVPAKEEPEGSV